MKLRVATCIAAFLAAPALADPAADIVGCRGISDSLQRLVCYDGIAIDEKAPRPSPADSSATTSKTLPVELVRARLSHQDKDFELNAFNPRVELRLRFKNNSPKEIVALSLRARLKDAFGDVAVDQKAKLDIVIPPGKEADSPSFFYWDDNPFIPTEPYDQLAGAVRAGSATAEIVVDGIVFKDGSTEHLQN